MAAGMMPEARTGRFTAVCGTLVLGALMSDPPGPCCPRCVAFLQARESTRPVGRRKTDPQRRRTLWDRLLGHGILPRIVPVQRRAGHELPGGGGVPPVAAGDLPTPTISPDTGIVGVGPGLPNPAPAARAAASAPVGAALPGAASTGSQRVMCSER